MKTIDSIEALEALYGAASEGSLVKVATRMTPAYRRWIMASRFCVLSTVGPEGADGSPRGDDGPVVAELDDRTLAMPDWQGNQRIDSLRNIVRDGRAALMFFVPGSKSVVRVNGKASLTADEALRRRFERKGMLPRSVTLLHIEEIYIQCPKAILRSRLWASGDESAELPSLGDILAERSDGRIGGADYDEAYPRRAEETMW